MARKASQARESRPPSRAAIDIKRVYDAPSGDEGLRILVDRLWPRGVTKAALKLDAWPKELSPSNELRRWYGHVPDRFEEFRRRYLAELAPHHDKLDALRAFVHGRQATLLTATRELDLSHAHVLRDLLMRG